MTSRHTRLWVAVVAAVALNGADTLLGGDGNDLVDGNQGNDTAFFAAGDDLFQWGPG